VLVIARTVARAHGVLDDLLARARGGQFGLGGEAADDGHFGDSRRFGRGESSGQRVGEGAWGEGEERTPEEGHCWWDDC